MVQVQAGFDAGPSSLDFRRVTFKKQASLDNENSGSKLLYDQCIQLPKGSILYLNGTDHRTVAGGGILTHQVGKSLF